MRAQFVHALEQFLGWRWPCAFKRLHGGIPDLPLCLRGGRIGPAPRFKCIVYFSQSAALRYCKFAYGRT